jgi:predicted enzyme related to lactoylglutathione lyase
MPEMTQYTPGTPSWIDLGSPDPDASAQFYGELFGWETTEAGPVEETGGYRMFLLRGKQVGGLMALMSEEQPPAWTTYVSTDDADGVTARATAAGGTVLAPVMDVMDAGRMAIMADPVGAVFGTWQPGEHKGAELVNEAGALAWDELATRDMDASKGFYAAVFGWDASTSEMGPMEYTEFLLGGKTIAGGLELGDDVPAAVPPHWLAYFGVEDCDAALARANALGGSTILEPMDIPAGRFAQLRDPHGAALGIIALAG